MSRSPVGAALLAPACLVVGACGGDASLPEVLDGAAVGARVERQLQAQHSSLAPGTLDCPDLELTVGAAVRCLRTSELSGGRVVKVRGTVKVTTREGGGRVHVVMDERAEEFGLSGEQLAREVGGGVDCPYLPGEVGTRVVCIPGQSGDGGRVEVVVTAVDEDEYRTDFRARPLGRK